MIRSWLVGLVALFLIAVAPASAQNLVTNGSFDSNLAGWTLAGSSELSITWDGAFGRTAPGSASVARSAATATSPILMSQCLPVVASTSYDVSGWMYYSSTVATVPTTTFRLSWFSDAACTPGSLLGADTTSTATAATPGVWQMMSAAGRIAPATAQGLLIEVAAAFGAGGASQLWLDDWSGVSSSTAVACATNPMPADGATGVATTTTLSWDAVSGADGYRIGFGTTSPPPLVADNGSSTSYTVSGTSPNTKYYWQIVPYDAGVEATGCEVWSFTTSSCGYSILPTNATVPSAGGSGTVAVTTSTGCPWSAASNASWLTITSGASGNGSGSVDWSAAANGDGTARIGTLTIAGLTFTVTQSGTCGYAIEPPSASYDSAGGSGAVVVTAGPSCPWTVVSNDFWITVTSDSSGTGNGSVAYTVAANGSSAARSGSVSIAGLTFSVTQSGTCGYSTNPLSASFGASGGTGSVSVYAGEGCPWSASSNVFWISITNGRSGTGNGIVEYAVAGNPSAGARAGTLTIAGRTFRVTQAGTCGFAISPASAAFGAAGGAGSVAVAADAGCGWTAVSNVSWISIAGVGSGSGNGSVTYSIAANGSSGTRVGTLTIAGLVFTVVQQGSCVYSIGPTTATFGVAGGTGSVAVSAGAECPWIAFSNASWIIVTSSSIGAGAGTVTYSVASNPLGLGRSGTITIAGLFFTVVQSGPPCDLPEGRFVPAAAHAPGLNGSFFVTDLRILNTGVTTAGVRIEFLKQARDNSGAACFSLGSLAPRATLAIDDVGALTGEETWVGGILIASDSTDLLVTSRTYNLAVAGTFGQGIAGIEPEHGIDPGENGRLFGLTETAEYRSNVGFLNGGLAPSTVRLEIRNSNGDLLGTVSEVIPARGQVQLNRILKRVTSVDTENASILIQVVGGPVFAYASIVDNVTNDPTYFEAVVR